MSSKRVFKKAVDSLANAVVEEMFLAAMSGKDTDNERVFVAAQNIIAAMATARSRANRFFGKSIREFGSYKEYKAAKSAFFKASFKEATDEFNAALSAGMKEFNSAVAAKG